jgi:hypothetical protein
VSKGDHDARVLQDATGAKYMACLARVRSLREIRPKDVLDSFMDRVDALPDLIDGQTRCVTCLQNLTPTKECRCI